MAQSTLMRPAGPRRPAEVDAAPAPRAALPSDAELRAFATTAAPLLVERLPRAPGAKGLSRRAGVGLQHLDHREYQPGDEVRHIDWRQTARSRKPILRQFEAESVTDWTLVLDASSSMVQGSGAKWRVAVAMVAAMSYALLQVGHRVGLLAFGSRVLAQCPRGRGPQHHALLVRTLLALQPRWQGEGTAMGACARHLHGAAQVMVISDFLAPGEGQRDLAALLAHCTNLHVLRLSDPADVQLPIAGPLELVDAETGRRLPMLVEPATIAQASANEAALAARLAGFCARRGLAHADASVMVPWQQRLLAHLVRARRLG